MAGRNIIEVVAVAVIADVCPDVSLVMTQIKRSGMSVMGREMIPVPGRVPGYIRRSQQTGENQRPGIKDRLNDIVGPVYVRRTYNLYAGIAVSGDFSNERGDILIDVGGEDRLDKEHVGTPVHGLNDAQIINITVPVQIQVGNHIGRVVQQALEFLDGRRLRECR